MREKRVDLGFQSDITWDHELIDSRPLSENSAQLLLMFSSSGTPVLSLKIRWQIYNNAPDLEIKSDFILHASVLISDHSGTPNATDNFVLAQFRETWHKKKNK